MKTNHFYLFIISICYIFPSACLETLYIKNQNIFNSDYFYISSRTNNKSDSLFTIYIENNKRIKILRLNEIIISDLNKTIRYVGTTNQLFIDKTDSTFNKMIFSLSDSTSFVNMNKNIYFKNVKLFLDEICENIDSLILSYNNQDLIFTNIVFDTLNIINPDRFFSLDIDENSVFKYDFR